MIKLLVADDHPIIRHGIRQILEETSDIAVVAEADSGDALLAQAAGHHCDVVIMDISMPGRNWLDVIRELSGASPRLAILVLSRHAETQYATSALKAGAHGYLTKTSMVEELVNAVRMVYSGQRYISPDLAQKLAFTAIAVGPGARLPHEMLSLNELKVFIEIVRGKTIKEISEEASLSQSTISTYRSRILQKMNLKTDAELIRYGLQHGIVD